VTLVTSKTLVSYLRRLRRRKMCVLTAI